MVRLFISFRSLITHSLCLYIHISSEEIMESYTRINHYVSDVYINEFYFSVTSLPGD